MKNETKTLETSIPKISGWLTVIPGIAIILYIIYGIYDFYTPKPAEIIPSIYLIIKGVISLILAVLFFSSNTVIKPNRADTYTFLGNYKGTLRGPGFFVVPCWWHLQKDCNLALDTIKVKSMTVNDNKGNPIIIGCSIFCIQKDTYAATFEVSEVSSYLQLKAETALRALAMKYAMDSIEEGVHTLRGSVDEVKETLLKEVTQDFVKAGYIVDSVAITSLHYSPEIAGMMLQRQQAQSIVDARRTITEGAMSIVKEAVEKMKAEVGIELTEPNKQKLASNLLITLCSHQPVSPVMDVAS